MYGLTDFIGVWVGGLVDGWVGRQTGRHMDGIWTKIRTHFKKQMIRYNLCIHKKLFTTFSLLCGIGVG